MEYNNQETPDAEKLRQMPYSELKKVAKMHGIKGNMKAEKIIKSLLSVSSNDLDGFSTPLQTEINSSRKNKENKFDEDQMTPLDTPRRGTYTIESPSEYFLTDKSKLDDTLLKSAAESKPDDTLLKSAAESKPDDTPLKSAAESKPDDTPLKFAAKSKPLKSAAKSKPLKSAAKSKPDDTPLKSAAKSKPLKSAAKSKPDDTPLKSAKSKPDDTPLKPYAADNVVKAESRPNATSLESSIGDSIKAKIRSDATPLKPSAIDIDQAKSRPSATPLNPSAADSAVEAKCRPSATPLNPSVADSAIKAKSRPSATPLNPSVADSALKVKSRQSATPLNPSVADSAVTAKRRPSATPLISSVVDFVDSERKSDATPLKSPAVLGKRKLDATPFASSTDSSSVSAKKKANNTPCESCAVDNFPSDLFNVTMCRGSERKLRPRKVSFMTPKKMTPQSPKYISLKDRPKTPVASRLSVGKRVSFSTPIRQQQRRSIEKVVRTTPHPHSNKSKRDSSSVKKVILVDQTSTKSRRTSITPSSVKKITLVAQASAKSSRTSITPSANRRNPSSEQKPNKIKRTQTPSSNRRNPSSEQKSAKIKRTQTPNFKNIHQKAFDKMESIDDYQKRKNQNSAKKLAASKIKVKASKPKSKIPVPFSGIPFIPSATSTLGLNFDFGSRTTSSTAPSENKVVSQPKVKVTFSAKTGGKSKAASSKENIPCKAKTKFDLKASLSRKLGYRPYTGHVKPLSELNASTLSAPACLHNAGIKENRSILVENRSKTRALLRGVRTNKRFELLMKNRNL